MRKPGHDVPHAFLCAGEKHLNERFEMVDGIVNGVAGIQAHIRCDLIVSRAGSVQFFACLTDAGDEFALHKRVDILLSFDGESAAFDVGVNAFEAFADVVCFLRGENSALSEHGRMRDGSRDVCAPKFFIEGERFVECVGVRRLGRVEPSLPEFHDRTFLA